MESIQLQALRLEFRDEFDDTYARTKSYVKGLIGKPWWTNTKSMISGEGGLDMMTQHCMLFQIEQPTRLKGYQAYTAHLSYLYGSGMSHNSKKDSLDSLDYDKILLSRSEGASSALTHGEELVQDWGEEFPEWLSKEQADFLLSHLKMGTEEAAEAHGLTVDEAWKEYRRIMQKRDYHARKPEAITYRSSTTVDAPGAGDVDV